MDDSALLATNTSSLPVTELGRHLARPANFIGLHFFSPVHRMELVEIVVGTQTSQETVARAFDAVLQMGKTPIVVRDSRGFFTSRVFARRLDEAVAMLGEGLSAASVEQAGLQSGYLAGPLALIDEVSLELTVRIRREAQAAAAREGREWQAHGSEATAERLLQDGRLGRAAGAGLYDYGADGRRERLWPGLTAHRVAGHAIPMRDMQERLLFAEALESVRCLKEGVLSSEEDGNIGSLLGIGFPVWTGGVFRYIDTYPGGRSAFVVRARQLAEAYGPRFLPPALLLAMARSDEPDA